VTPWVLHVDLDAFLAAAEVLRRPELAGRPVVVGGTGEPAPRTVVAAASYEARARGVHAGMPLRTAVRRCPDAVLLPKDDPYYEAVSADVVAALRGLPGAVVEVLGWDEAFVGVELPDGAAPEDRAREVQDAVLAATGLHCSVGIGDDLVRAKTATAFGKPRGVFRLTRDDWFAVMGERPTDALWGVGAKTARKLAERGLRTVADLAAADPAALAADLGPATGPWLVQLARGVSRVRVDPTPWVRRSLSHETTFPADLTDWDDVRREVAALAGAVAADLAAEDRPAARVAVKLRFAPFTTRSRSATLPSPTTDAAELEAAALRVLELFPHRRPVRLAGVRAEFPDPPAPP
jgi:DNA polymerase IV